MTGVAAFLLLMVGALSTAAGAQTESDVGSRIQVPKRARIPDNADGDQTAARIVTAEFARCVVARNPSGVARAVDIIPGPGSVKAMTALATSECLDSGQMRIPQLVMRGAIFVEMFRLYHSRKIEIGARRPMDLNNPLDAEFRGNPVRLALLGFADCVIGRDPSAASDVVLLPTASKSQDAAFKILIPNLGPCLTNGQQIRFSKPILEGAIAEVLYRGTVAPVAAAGSK